MSKILALSALSVVLVASACKNGAPAPENDKKATPVPSPAAILAAEKKPQKSAAAPVRPTGSVIPQGNRQLITPGRGISAIFFGATKETIERHMGSPCDISSETRCVYVDQAIAFTLTDGVVSRINVHRRDRPVKDEPGRLYGTFHGMMLPAIMLGLHRHVTEEEYGVPLKKEEIALQGDVGMVERFHYDGVILEFDKIENGNVVLAGIEVVPSKTAKAMPEGSHPPPL